MFTHSPLTTPHAEDEPPRSRDGRAGCCRPKQRRLGRCAFRAWLFPTMQGSSWQRSHSTSTAPPGPSRPTSRPRPPRPSAQQLEKLLWGDSGIKAILGWLGRRRRLGPAMLDASITGQSVRSCWPTSPELLFAGTRRQPGEEVHRQGRGLWMGGEARGPDVPQGGGTWLNW